MHAKDKHDLYEYFFGVGTTALGGRILLIIKCMVVVLYTHSHALIYFQPFHFSLLCVRIAVLLLYKSLHLGMSNGHAGLSFFLLARALSRSFQSLPVSRSCHFCVPWFDVALSLLISSFSSLESKGLLEMILNTALFVHPSNLSAFCCTCSLLVPWFSRALHVTGSRRLRLTIFFSLDIPKRSCGNSSRKDDREGK